MTGYYRVPAGGRPLVTVIVSSYNRPKLLADAILSVVTESHREALPLQLIVADDWSDAPLVAELALAFSALLIRPAGGPPSAAERQWGQRCAVAINAALPWVAAPLVTFLPDDDFLYPGGLARRVAYLTAHPEVGGVYGRLEACKPLADPLPGIHVLPPTAGAEAQPCGARCFHDRLGFWQSAPLDEPAERLDHSMPVVRVEHRGRWLPAWVGEDPGARHDCPDARWFALLEAMGWTPFHSIHEVVTVKRYHRFGHRTDPQRRE